MYGAVDIFPGATIPEGSTLTVPEGSSLHVPDDATLTVNGTLSVDGTLTVDGALAGTGTITPKLTSSISITASLDKVADGAAVSLGTDGYTYDGNATPSVTWHADDNGTMGAALAQAPSAPGAYWVEVSASETSFYQAASDSKRFVIAVPTYEVTLSASPSEGGSVSGAGTYEEGVEVSVVATPAEGYHFVCWQEGGSTVVGAGATYDFAASSDRALTAVFDTHDFAGDYLSDDSGHWLECAVCGASGTVSQHAPAEDDGDCTTPVLCEVCGYATTPASGSHDFGDWASNGDGTHTRICATPGCEKGETQDCALADGVCGVCGYECEHSFTRYIRNDDASCMSDGTETAACDFGCGVSDTRRVEGTALGHELVRVPRIDSTDGRDGMAEHWACERCGELFLDSAGKKAVEKDDLVLLASGGQDGSKLIPQTGDDSSAHVALVAAAGAVAVLVGFRFQRQRG